MIFWSIFRNKTGTECASNFEDSEETVDSMIEILKTRIDAELKDDDPWRFKEREGRMNK